MVLLYLMQTQSCYSFTSQIADAHCRFCTKTYFVSLISVDVFSWSSGDNCFSNCTATFFFQPAMNKFLVGVPVLTTAFSLANTHWICYCNSIMSLIILFSSVYFSVKKLVKCLLSIHGVYSVRSYVVLFISFCCSHCSGATYLNCNNFLRCVFRLHFISVVLLFHFSWSPLWLYLIK